MVDVPLHASLLRPSDWLGSIEERLDRLGGRRVAGGWHLTNLLRARTTLAEVGPSNLEKQSLKDAATWRAQASGTARNPD